MSIEASAGSQPDAGRDEFAAWAAPSMLAMNRFASRLVPVSEVDEVVQNALVRAWVKQDKYDPARGSATTWLLAIVADQARITRRGLRRRQAVIDESADYPETSDAHQRSVSDRFDAVDAAVSRLPRRQQLAVQLHYFVGLSVEQTGQVMDCTSGTVKSTLFEARKRLRTMLGEHHAE